MLKAAPSPSSKRVKQDLFCEPSGFVWLWVLKPEATKYILSPKSMVRQPKAGKRPSVVNEYTFIPKIVVIWKE